MGLAESDLLKRCEGFVVILPTKIRIAPHNILLVFNLNRFIIKAILLFCLLSFLVSFAKICIVKASGAIYVMEDGSIDPSTAPIFTVDNGTYILIGNVGDSLTIRRTNIVVDGAGHTIQGKGDGVGILIAMPNIRNVTIKNTIIKQFVYGIQLITANNISIIGNIIKENKWYGISLLESSNHNIISGNTITNNSYGIGLIFSSNYNTILGNSIENNDYGIGLESSNNVISWNNLKNNEHGIYFHKSSHNTVAENNITKNYRGIVLLNSSNNTLFKNTLMNNDFGVYLFSSNYTHISENAIGENHYGVILQLSSNNSITKNVLTDNEHSIELWYECYNNYVSKNFITGWFFQLISLILVVMMIVGGVIVVVLAHKKPKIAKKVVTAILFVSILFIASLVIWRVRELEKEPPEEVTFYQYNRLGFQDEIQAHASTVWKLVENFDEAKFVTSEKEFSVIIYIHPYTVGLFDPYTAEWVVIASSIPGITNETKIAIFRLDYQTFYVKKAYESSYQVDKEFSLDESIAIMEEEMKKDPYSPSSVKREKVDLLGGNYIYFYSPMDFGGIIIVNKYAGKTIFYATIVWSGTGKLIIPEERNPWK